MGVLERPRNAIGNPIEPRFNPWKGFGGFGTLEGRNGRSMNSRFNPWKGFGGFGTLNVTYFRVSTFKGFNPWKGFGGFGTTVTVAIDVF